MVFNPNFILSLLFSLLLLFVSTRLFKAIKNPYNKIAFFGGCFILALISFVIPAAYWSNSIGENPLYCEFRAYPYTELLVILVVPLVAVVNVWLADRKSSLGLNRFVICLCLAAMLLFISLPFIKPLIRPVQDSFNNQWQDNIAIQTTFSTCGPSSLATLFKYYGRDDTEANIARQAFTSATGTESWYLARYAYAKGFSYQFLHEADLRAVPTPAIIGVQLGSIGHFVVLLSQQDGVYEVADPLTGRALLSLDQFNHQYRYRGFVLYIQPLASK